MGFSPLALLVTIGVIQMAMHQYLIYILDKLLPMSMLSQLPMSLKQGKKSVRLISANQIYKSTNYLQIIYVEFGLLLNCKRLKLF
jgi:hypothetical protein